LLDFNADDFMKKMSTRRIIFSGDSFIRQVMIAFSCLLEKHGMIAHREASWATCHKKWPCHYAKNCIQCGPHSGFDSFSFSMKNSQRHPQMQYANELIVGMGTVGALKQGDIVLLQPGIRDTPEKATDMAWKNVVKHTRSKVKVVWVHTWPAHFLTTDGEYNVSELERQDQASQGGNSSHVHSCVGSTSLQRKDVEAHSILARRREVLDGSLWLSGIEKLGAAKVCVCADISVRLPCFIVVVVD
jgi:hypothetical protein